MKHNFYYTVYRNVYNTIMLKIKTYKIMITPNEFVQSFDTYQAGHKDFCKFVSVSSERNGNPSHQTIGFWFRITKDELNYVLSITEDSIVVDQPEQTIMITTQDQLYTFVENMRKWAEDELSVLLAEKYVQATGSCC